MRKLKPGVSCPASWADHLAVNGAARLKVGLRGADLGGGGAEPGAGLGNVGTGVLANLETVLRRPYLLAQKADIAPAQAKQGLVAQYVHVAFRGIQQHILDRVCAGPRGWR